MREVVVLALLAGCGGSPSSERDAGATTATVDAASAATFSEIYDALFPAATAPRCNFCHSMPPSDTSNGHLSMGSTKDAAYSALVGPDSTSSHCGGMAFVVPGDPESSLFYLKLVDPAPCGARMPLGGAALGDAQLAKVHGWIAAGAKND